MKSIVVIDNFDSFTFNLVDYFEQLNCSVTTRRNTVSAEEVEAMNPDLIVLSPGPSIPSTAGNMMKIIERTHRKIPLFGVCLGHEALIEFFGGSLKFTTPVHGKASPITHDGKTIFTDLDPDFSAGRYHSLVADQIPNPLTISATTDDLVMAVRHKELPIEGVQFHPESVLTFQGKNGFRLIHNVIHALCR